MIFLQEESIWNNENTDSVLAPSFKFNEIVCGRSNAGVPKIDRLLGDANDIFGL